ncbi:phage baseplate assembly protein V [Georgenia yuyongxinii]
MSVILAPSDGMSLSPVVKVGGSALATRWTDAVMELRVEVALRTVGRCTMRFADPGYALAEEGRLVVGTDVAVSARAVRERSPLTEIFRGTVTSVGLEQREAGTPELIVVVEDAAYELTRTSRARTFLNIGYADVVTKVVSGAGVSVKVDALSGQQEYLLQTDTDLGFVDEIARRVGYDWVVDGGTFRFWSSWAGRGRTGTIGPDVEVTAGDALRDFAVTVAADAPTSVTVRGWDPVQQQVVTATKQVDRGAVPAGLARVVGPARAKDAEQLTAVAGPADAAEASQLAEARARATGTVTAKGRCTITPGIRPGVLVAVAGVGPAAGKYFVQQVEHVYRPGGFHTRFVAGDREPARRAAAAGAGTGAAPSSFAHKGLVIGTVTDINDEVKVGRVKVRYSALSDTVTSSWARVAAIGGGADRGLVALPEVGDEVLVGFEDGDARRPVVLGGLFGKKNKVPDDGAVGSGKVTHRRLTSRLGHVVELGDGTGAKEQHVLLALAGSTHKVRLGKDRADIEVPAGVPLRLAAGNSEIVMDGKGAVTISGLNITIKATQALELSGLNVTAKASAKAAISGAQAELQGSATAAVQGGATTTIKGGMVQIN